MWLRPHKGERIPIRDGVRVRGEAGVGYEPVGEPQRDAIDDHYAACEVVLAQVNLLFYVSPLRAAAFLMTAYTLLELLVPDVCRSQINRIIT